MIKHDKIFWHEAFYEAVRLELHEYEKYLTFEEEHPLSKEALLMDMLVVKKNKDVAINKNIGQIFKGHNIIEFKSEADSFSRWDYSKVLGYVHLYSSFNKVPLSDITLTISLTLYPRVMVKYIEGTLGLTVRNVDKGIYYIEGEVIPLQILESKKMTNEDNVFIRNLRSGVKPKDIETTLNEYKKIKPLDARAAYLNRLLKANPLKPEEAKFMFTEDSREAVMEIIDERGWLDARDVARDVEIKKQAARKMLLRGYPPEEVADINDLPLDVVLNL